MQLRSPVMMPGERAGSGFIFEDCVRGAASFNPHNEVFDARQSSASRGGRMIAIGRPQGRSPNHRSWSRGSGSRAQHSADPMAPPAGPDRIVETDMPALPEFMNLRSSKTPPRRLRRPNAAQTPENPSPSTHPQAPLHSTPGTPPRGQRMLRPLGFQPAMDRLPGHRHFRQPRNDHRFELRRNV